MLPSSNIFNYLIEILSTIFSWYLLVIHVNIHCAAEPPILWEHVDCYRPLGNFTIYKFDSNITMIKVVLHIDINQNIKTNKFKCRNLLYLLLDLQSL